MSVLLEASHLSKRFGRIQAVDDLSLTLSQGEVLGLLGSNGAGKTTLIRMLCSLILPDGGSISMSGKYGYMCQQFSLVEELTVPENIRFYGALYSLSRRQVDERAEEMISSLGLEPYCDRPVKQLPTGWRQALAFSIAVIAEPEVLILDEPTSGLDPLSRRRLWGMIHEKAAEGCGIIVSTHYLDEAYYCSRLALMHAGRLAAYGAPMEVAASEYELLKYYDAK